MAEGRGPTLGVESQGLRQNTFTFVFALIVSCSFKYSQAWNRRPPPPAITFFKNFPPRSPYSNPLC